jgi:4-diphosphocytidyl-2-C-methyl-D-erythritol kinase
MITVRAHAKINLALRVVGVRPDGFHELQTVFQSLALHDTLEIEAARGPLDVASDDPRCPAGRDNLVWRAAAAVWRASGRQGAPRGAAVRLIKRVPMAAGLGGGSSDAAAALRAFAALWRVRADRLPALAAGLGSDVPYFLHGGTALGLERGDLIVRLSDARPAWVVLVVPPFGVRTADAYAWWDRRPSRVAHADRVGTNDLQAPVAARHPVIAGIVRAFARQGAAAAAMSGSGSSVFGLFTSRTHAQSAARALAARGRTVLVTRTIGRAAYTRGGLVGGAGRRLDG